MKVHMTEVASYEDYYEFKTPLRLRVWRWILCRTKGHTPGLVFLSGEGVWELCGRCGKTVKVGAAVKRNPEVIFWSGPSDPLKLFPDLQNPLSNFAEWYPPEPDNSDGTGTDSESGDKKSS